MRRALLPLTLLALSSAAAYADSTTWTYAKVMSITVYTAGGSGQKGYVVVTFESNGKGTPKCATGYPKDLVIDMSTPGGAFAAGVVQSSLLLGMTLTVTGTGGCSVIPTTETMASIEETPHGQ